MARTNRTQPPGYGDVWRLGFASALAAYGVITALLSGRLSLWVDEILQLIGTRDSHDLQSLLRWVEINPGGVPLGYFTQHFAIWLFGFSAYSSRIPSVICSVLACAAVAWLARRMGLGRSSACISFLIFATLPLQFRYALEGRPYSEALLFWVLSQIGFQGLCRRPGRLRARLYGLALLLGMYTQPFTAFIWLSHMAWATLFLKGPERGGVVRWCSLAGILAGFAFLPWFLLVRQQWHTYIGSSGYSFAPGFSIVSIIFREIPGNYVITVLLGLAVASGFAAQSPLTNGTKALLAANIIAPVVCALCADAAFNYFFAARQLVYVLPSIAVLAAAGAQNLARTRRRAGVALVSVLLLSTLGQDVRMFQKPREDWAKAAAATNAMLRETNACVITVPSEWAALYIFFEPNLAQRQCVGDQRASGRLLLAITPYTPAAAAANLRATLTRDGYAAGPQQTVGGSRLEPFSR
jgi:4-amino-4-deoxy-L-arabinose transferase-like glycosyltransferase